MEAFVAPPPRHYIWWLRYLLDVKAQIRHLIMVLLHQAIERLALLTRRHSRLLSPFLIREISNVTQQVLTTVPHIDSWMPLPAFTLAGNGFQNRQAAVALVP